MKKLFSLFITLIFSTLLIASNPLEVKEFTLKNGLKVWINEDHSQPKVIGAVVVKAGAKDSPNTGIAHYFEHIMFKGTDKIGTVNYAAEKILLDSISRQYDLLAETTDDSEREAIQSKINELSIQAAEYAIPNEFDRLISTYGGSGLNAGTSYDYTVYHNTFSSNYFEQWCVINSERLINPVFRGFQSELETVYEEKNMYDDALGQKAIEKTLERFFAPHPYQYSIIGSAENLKNPKLSDMKAFFEKYYVANNMGLLFSGDVDVESVIPTIEKYFGKIRSGNDLVNRNYTALSDFDGVEKFTAKVPIPIIKINALLWRGVPVNHADETTLKLVEGLLSNGNNNGLLDRLSHDGKVMQAMPLIMSLNDAGVVGVAAIPNIPFQSYKSAQRHVFNALEKIKKGDFSDELLNNLKLEQKRDFLTQIENIDSRTWKMISLFSENKKWEDYVAEVENIDKVTKADVVKVANKYFTTNYLDVTKKTGKYPNEKIEKPGFAPISPTNKNVESEFAKELKLIPQTENVTRFLDLKNEKEIIPLDSKGLSTLYYTPNEINDVFSFSLNYRAGYQNVRTAEAIANYLDYLGTDSLSLTKLNEKLQEIGSTMNFRASQQQFEISVKGFDRYFSETLDLVFHFIENVKADKSKLSKIISELKVEENATRKSSEELARAINEKVKYQDNSLYLNKLTSKELRKIKPEELLNDFKAITQTAFDVHYCGTLPTDNVQKLIAEKLQNRTAVIPSQNPIYRDLVNYSEPQVYFYNDPKATQSIIYGYLPLEKGMNDQKSSLIKLFNSYFGGSMSSLMFQEIREFRSLAYRAYSWVNVPTPKNTEKQAALNFMLSTQSDKTIDALLTLDSLKSNMPLVPLRFENARQDMKNDILNRFPNFRSKSKEVASQRNGGYNEDNNKTTLENISKETLSNLEKYYTQNIKDKAIVYMVVGNEKNVNMSELEKFGKIINLKQGDFLK